MRPRVSPYRNEAAVEWHVIEPLLAKLGYAKDDVAPKYPVVFQQGRKGRHHEADHAIFSGRPHGRQTSLFVAEAKRPGEPGWTTKDQAESYQHALRAPFLMIVDGETIEVWQYQSAGESECVFGPVPIAELDRHFADLSLILSKDAAIAHREKLRGPNARATAEDWSAYVNAELDRLDRFGFLVERSLTGAVVAPHVGPPGPSHLGSVDLTAHFPSGCAITAPSGFGKTSLACSIMRQCLEAYSADPAARLPVLIPCDDLASTSGVIEFVLQRLVVHKPGLTTNAVLQHINKHGLALVLDSFDRLSTDRRDELAKELRNLLRDYPKLQIFLLSRRGVLPSLGRPVVQLDELSDEQQRTLVDATLGESYGHLWSSAPVVLIRICRVPLLLDLALSFWQQHHAWPTGLPQMFDHWLNSIVTVGAGAAPSIQVSRRRGLQCLATRHSTGPVTLEAALTELQAAGFPGTLLDDLVAIDAVEIHASGITFPHDAMGDYLCALAWLARPEATLLENISVVDIEAGSLFPVLLLSIAKAPAIQRALWARLIQSDIHSYFDAIRYRADSSDILLAQGPEAFATHLLEELLDGIEQPLQAFYPQLTGAVRRELVDDDAKALAIIGGASPDAVHYGLVSKTDDQSRVNLNSPRQAAVRRYINLRLSHIRADGGRLIGTNLLRNAIDAVANARAFQAGPALASERLLGRLRYLEQEYEISLPAPATIEDALAEFEPHKDEYFCWPRPDDNRKTFLVAELIADLHVLRTNGLAMPSPWWRKDGTGQEIDVTDDAAIHFAIDEEVRRAQIIYTELVALNFKTLAHELAIHGTLPLRYEISIHRRNAADPDNVSVHRIAMPVAGWDMAGADLVPRGEDFPGFFRTYYDNVVAALDRLGRRPARVVARWSSGILGRFDGTDWLGNFDGETAAMRTACRWLDDDLKSLFEKLSRT